MESELESKFLVPEPLSGVLNFLTLESESESHKKTRTLHSWLQRDQLHFSGGGLR